MAVCFECHGAMRQTQTTCPHCGVTFVETADDAKHLLLHQSSLANLFRLSAVMAVFFALVPLLFSLQTSAFWPFLAGFMCGGCAMLLGDSAPLWSRLFSLAWIVAFLLYPLQAICILLWWMIRWLMLML